MTTPWSVFNGNAGVSPAAFSKAVLADLGAPQTAPNEQSLIAWFLLEGGGGQNNPMNTTLKTSGSTGVFNSDQVQDYATPADGAAATASTLQSSDYSAIVNDLKAGSGLANPGSAAATEFLTWSGNGYSSVSGTFDQAAAYLKGGGSVATQGAGGSTTGSSGSGSTPTPAASTGIVGDILSAMGLGSGDINSLLERAGLMILGGIMIVVGIVILFKDTAPAQAVKAAAPDAAVAAVAA